MNKNRVDGSILSVVDRTVPGSRIVRLSIVLLVGDVFIGGNGIVTRVICVSMGWTSLVGSVEVFRKHSRGIWIPRTRTRGI